MFLRMVLNTMHRMVYPFLAVFARGMGVDIATVSYIVTARSFVGMFAPLFGSFADSRGRRFGMLSGILLFTMGMGLVAIRPNFHTFSIALLLTILGKYFFDPSMQAYIGDRVPYERRGTALAVTEVAWSLSFIVGVPVMGFLIATYGWEAPFPVLAILGLVMIALVWRMIPRDDHVAHQATGSSYKNIRAVLTHIPALAGISIALWASQVWRAVNFNFPVKGYFYWSFIDNFEWALVYKPRFGLVHVDYTTLRRTIKESGYWYRQVIKDNGLLKESIADYRVA